MPTTVADVLDPAVRLAAGDLLPLGPWDVRVLELTADPASVPSPDPIPEQEQR